MSYMNDGALANFDGTDMNNFHHTSQKPKNVETTEKMNANAKRKEGMKDLARLEDKIHDTNAMSDDEFFDSRKWLQIVSKASRTQGVAMGRWGVAAETLACLAARLPPNVTIEPLIYGKPQTLNLFIADEAISGIGKKNTIDLASSLIPMGQVGIQQVASGEAIPALFIKREPTNVTDKKSPTQPVFMSACQIIRYSEAGWLSGASSRQGSTMIPTFEAAFSDERLGGATKKMDNSVTLPAGCYRLCMIVDVQPDQAKVFMSNEGTGFPQRFYWTTPSDPDMTERDYDIYDTGNHPVQFLIKPQDLPVIDGSLLGWLTEKSLTTIDMRTGGAPVIDMYTIRLPKSAKILIRKRTFERVTGKNVNSKDGHRMEVVSRIAALFAILNECGPDSTALIRRMPLVTQVSEEDWALAERFMKHSDEVRDSFLSQERHEQLEKGRQYLEDKHAVRDAYYRRLLVKRLKRYGPSDLNQLLSGVRTNLRDDYTQALENEKGKRILCRTIGSEGKQIYYLKEQADAISQRYDEPPIIVKREDVTPPLKPADGLTIPNLNDLGFRCNYIPFTPTGKEGKGCAVKINGMSWMDAAKADLPGTQKLPEHYQAIAVVPGPHELIWDLDVNKKDPTKPSGWEQMQMFCGLYGSKGMPQSTVPITPHGGFHYPVLLPPDLWGRIKEVNHPIDGLNIDIKACQQGYVVGAGSKLPIGSYRICDNHRPPMLTKEQRRLLDYMGAIIHKRPKLLEAPRIFHALHGTGEPRRPIFLKGNRNSGEFGYYVNRAKHYPQDWEQQKAELYEDAHAMGLGDTEIKHITNSVYKTAKQDGAPLP